MRQSRGMRPKTKRIPPSIGEPRECDGECGNDGRRDRVWVRRRTTTHILSWERFWTLFQSDERPWAGMDGRSASCCFTDWICFCRSMTFFSSHAMVMDWEMTSRSRWSAAASLANDCASVMICGSAFHRAMASTIRLLPTIFGLRPALAKMLVGPLPRKYCAMQRTWNSLE